MEFLFKILLRKYCNMLSVIWECNENCKLYFFLQCDKFRLCCYWVMVGSGNIWYTVSRKCSWLICFILVLRCSSFGRLFVTSFSLHELLWIIIKTVLVKYHWKSDQDHFQRHFSIFLSRSNSSNTLHTITEYIMYNRVHWKTSQCLISYI